MASSDAELEKQAQTMAEQALASLPEGARAAKIGKVKEGILKRLKAAAGGPSGPGGPPTGAPPPGPPCAPPPPGGPPPPPGSAPVRPALERLPGIEMCGDEAWFADVPLRQALRESVAAAHAEQKILVGPPFEEIRRIWPGGDRVLGAGAVLRLGGSLIGGYGDSDVNYAYRRQS